MTSNRHQAAESTAWTQHADALARWAKERMVNRDDAWGAYGRDGSFTAPAKSCRGRVRLRHNVLHNHFAGRHTIGLHAIS